LLEMTPSSYLGKAVELTERLKKWALLPLQNTERVLESGLLFINCYGIFYYH
jgi:hypothetical protein